MSNYIISANSARKLVSAYEAQKKWDDYAWNRLFTQIAGEAKAGKTSTVFYENLTSFFHESRTEVKERLEKLGYTVYYERFKLYEDSSRPHESDSIYMNKYYIVWEET